MTDQWFIQEVEHKLKRRNRLVILDPKGLCGFLLPLLDGKGYHVVKTDATLKEAWETVKEELFLRYEAETNFPAGPVIFYTTRAQDDLSFLFDYCFTHGCLDLSNPYEWIKHRIFTNTGLQIKLDNPMLLTAAKLAIGKDIGWWKKILQGLEELVSVDEELLPFLDDPDRFLQTKDKDIRRLFEEKLFELIGMPYMKKPPGTLAKEVAYYIFNGLANNEISENWLKLYYRWVDSDTYSSSLQSYISTYKISPDANPWAAHPDHCFPLLDEMALRQVSANIADKSFRKEKLLKIKSRSSGKKVRKLIPSWWQDIVTLMVFDMSGLANCTKLDQFVTWYTSSFFTVDRAIRNLYGSFLQDQKIIRPIQEYYESLNHELLQRWFELARDYRSNQPGFLPDLLKKAKPGTAVIVGDGIRYEVADAVARNLSEKTDIQRNAILADMPSDTEHNMSVMYVGAKQVIKYHKDREKKLLALTKKPITFIDLEALHYGIKADYLVLTYRDIDETAEELQHGAIKLFNEFEKVLTDKISLLLNMGFHEVHLVTDHGFVLTGLLDESDKITPAVSGNKKVMERYIRTADKPAGSEWIVFEQPHGEYKYVVTARSHRPFKSTGKYGYSHGGFTPQEIIIPHFIFRKEKEIVAGLKVSIVNKPELANITGEVFGIKIQADAVSSDLFSSERKVQILLYESNVQFGSSSLLSIQAAASQGIEFSFGGRHKILAVLVDAGTQEQLDNAVISKSGSRDLSGLF